MPKVTRGTPRSLQARNESESISVTRAGAANPLIDGNRIWSGRSVGLFSIPNPTGEPVYIRVEVGNLSSVEYTLCFERDVLNSAQGAAYPIKHQADFDSTADPLLKIVSYDDRQRQSGAMFTIPPQSRVHVAIRLNRDRNDHLDFPVALNEHAGPDRDSPTMNDRPKLKSLEWIPAPTADTVEAEVFAMPSKFLFWDLPPEPGWVRFRRWNVDPRTGKFPWSLGFFHHPECIVRVRNNSTLPVQVTPRLVFNREDAQGNAVRAERKELLDTRFPLDPGEGQEWPCTLSLEDKRLPKQEADQLRISAYVDVVGPGNTLIGEVKAPECVRGEYQPYPSKIIDWVVLVGGLALAVLLLLWTFVGIPNPEVDPQVTLKLEFKGYGPDSLPNGISPRNQLNVQLKSVDNRYVPLDGEYSKPNLYKFKFPKTPFGRKRLFLGDTLKDLTGIFNIVMKDGDGTMEIRTPQENYSLKLHPHSNITNIDQIDANPTQATKLAKHADDDLNQAADLLQKSMRSMSRGDPPPAAQLNRAEQLINRAEENIDKANILLDAPVRAKLKATGNQLNSANEQVANFERTKKYNEGHVSNSAVPGQDIPFQEVKVLPIPFPGSASPDPRHIKIHKPVGQTNTLPTSSEDIRGQGQEITQKPTEDPWRNAIADLINQDAASASKKVENQDNAGALAVSAIATVMGAPDNADPEFTEATRLLAQADTKAEAAGSPADERAMVQVAKAYLYRKQGLKKRDLGLSRAAATHCDKAIEYDPTLEYAYLVRIQLWLEAHDSIKALEVYQKARMLSGFSEAVLNFKGILQLLNQPRWSTNSEIFLNGVKRDSHR